MKHKRFESILFSSAGVAVMLVIVVVLNFIFSSLRLRADFTAEHLHTLSSGTKAILAKMEGPVEVRFYTTQGENADPLLSTYLRRVDDLLSEYRRLAKGKIELKKLDPQPDSEAEDSARFDGLEPQPTPTGEATYLGLVVSHLDQKQVLPLSPQREPLLEYDLSRALSGVTVTDKPGVGVMSPLPLFGQPMNPMMMRMGQTGSEPWVFISELQRDFNVKKIEMDASKIDDDIKVLIVAHPKDISDAAQYAIDQFIMRGGRLIALLDATSLVDSRKDNPMMQMPGGGSSLDKLLKAWGVQFDNTKVVADMTFAGRLGGRDGRPQTVPAFLFVGPAGINAEDAVTAQLDNIMIPFAGTFSGTPAPGLKQTVLLKTTANSQLVDGMMAAMSGESTIKDFKSSGTIYNIALRLTGKFKTAFPDGKPDSKDTKDEEKPDAEKKPGDPDKKAEKKPDNSLKETTRENSVILVGDADFLSDQFSVRVNNLFGQKIIQPFNGNLNFAQNMVEQMAGDNDLIGARSRATGTRPFTMVRKMEAEAQENYRSKIKEIEESLAETQRRLSELQTKKEAGQKFILSPDQQNELANFKQKESLAKKDLKKVRKQLRQDIDSLENRLKWLNIAGMPFVVVLAGLSAALFKRQRNK